MKTWTFIFVLLTGTGAASAQPANQSKAERRDFVEAYGTRILAQKIEFLPFVRTFALSGECLTGGRNVERGAWIKAGADVQTGAEGGLSLYLGETGEIGTARLGVQTEVWLPAGAADAGAKQIPPPESGASASEAAARFAPTFKDCSMELRRGRLSLAVEAGLLVHNPDIPFRCDKFRLNTEFVLKTPAAMVAGKEAQFWCVSEDERHAIGVLEGSVRVTPLTGGEAVTLSKGRVWEMKANESPDVRATTEEEQTAHEKQAAPAALKRIPLDVFVIPRLKKLPWQGWSRETKPDEMNWLDWKQQRSSVDLRTNNAQIAVDGLVRITMSRSDDFWRPLFVTEALVREGELLRDEKGVQSIPTLPLERVQALRFKMRAKNLWSLIYHVKERYPLPEHRLWFNDQADQWQDYHLPLAMPSQLQNAGAKYEPVHSDYRAYFRLFSRSLHSNRPTSDQIVIEMKDFEAVAFDP